MSQGNNLYAERTSSKKQYPRNKDLPKWDYDGHRIFAKDETTAIKYAKKRGFYKEGIDPTRIPDEVVIINNKQQSDNQEPQSNET